ncbi:MAG: hypothetical protein EHM20_08335 [Alphaproteobacteria bacterium]|nr:MAG: hypothetical protein EHM20_12940 [Alphaproteobacteria bacterium]RPJ75826.1 MAG: hypothetical protein EHM20_08335 [Alphaproteobacteria bacterium]
MIDVENQEKELYGKKLKEQNKKDDIAQRILEIFADSVLGQIKMVELSMGRQMFFEFEVNMIDGRKFSMKVVG